MEDTKIERIEAEEKGVVYEFLKQWFFTAEPITSTWDQPPPMEPLSCIRALPHRLSLKAVDAQGNILAVCINADPDKLNESHRATLPDNLKKMYEFFDAVLSECTVPEGLMYVLVMSVSGLARRRGLCSKLLRASHELASRSGYRGAFVMGTSRYTGAAAASLGWVALLDKPYASYLDGTGRPLYRPAAPHTHITVYHTPL